MSPMRPMPPGYVAPQGKPGMPPQGGKGGVRPMQPQMPPQGGKGKPQTTLNLNSGQQVPVQGGKGLAQTLPPPGQGSTMPAQGGKGQNFGPNVFPGPQQPQTTLNLNSGQQVPMQPQVPAQGGKAPLTPEQQATLGNAINTRPMPQQPQVMPMPPGGGYPAMQPQVQQLAPGQVAPDPTSRQAYDRMMAVTSFSGSPPTYEQFVQNRLNQPQMPQVMPQKPGVPMSPQVLPQKPMPANMAPQPVQGLAGLQNMLYGKQ